MGRVVSNRMQKTVVVAVDYVVWRPKLKVYEKRTSKHFAHDEKQECNIGDTVRIDRTLRRSKHKSYLVRNILKRVNVYTPELGAAAAAEAALASKQHSQSRVELAGAEYQVAQQRFQKLKELKEQYQQQLAASQLVTADGDTGTSSSSTPSSSIESSPSSSSSSSSSNPTHS